MFPANPPGILQLLLLALPLLHNEADRYNYRFSQGSPPDCHSDPALLPVFHYCIFHLYKTYRCCHLHPSLSTKHQDLGYRLPLDMLFLDYVLSLPMTESSSAPSV